MVEIGLVSDLHTEFWYLDQHEEIGKVVQRRLAGADVVLLPGDIGLGAKSVEKAAELFPDRPVLMVAGNHEFYNAEYHTIRADMKVAANDLSRPDRPIHVLNRDVVELTVGEHRLRVIGATLWTDFLLHGPESTWAMHDAKALNDFRVISYRGRTFEPKDSLLMHMAERSWLMAAIDVPFDGSTVVMTHHAPVSFAIAPKYVGDRLSPCFASRYEDMLARPDVELVVWGHTHYCVDRRIETTRFVSNQTGYPGLFPPVETGEFGQIITLP